MPELEFAVENIFDYGNKMARLVFKVFWKSFGLLLCQAEIH